MNKKSKRIKKAFSPVKLYLDDIEEIVNLLKKISEDVQIETSTHEKVQLSDLRSNLNENIAYDIELKTYNPYVSIETEDFGIFGKVFSMHAADGDDEMVIGVLDKISRILRRNRIWYLFGFRFVFAVIMLSPLLAAMLDLIFYKGDIDIRIYKIVPSEAAFYPLLMLILVLFFTQYTHLMNNRLILKKRTEQDTFFTHIKKNKGKIWLVAFGALLPKFYDFVIGLFRSLFEKF